MEAVSSSLSLTTVTLFLPMVGLTILLFMNEERSKDALRWTAFGFSIATFVASLVMALNFDTSVAGLQMAQQNDWLPALGVSYYVGVDGLSLLLVLLTTIILPSPSWPRSTPAF